MTQVTPQDEKPMGQLRNILAHCASVQAEATRLMLTQDWDLGAIFFDGLDLLGHCFMPYHPPQRPGVPEREFELFKDVVTGGYRFFDMMLESILAHAGEETTVILVSDHGFKSDDLRPQGDGWENPVDWHRQFGIAIAAGPAIEPGEVLTGASVLDVTPTVLHLLGLPVGRDMDGRPWLEILETRLSVDKVESWDDVAGDAGLHREELREDPAEAMAMIHQLVELGYVAPLGDDTETTIKQTLRDNQINLALSLFGSQRAAHARPIVDGLLKEYPEDALILSIAARMELSEGNAPGVREFALRSEAIDGRNLTVIGLLAEAAMIEEDYEQAIDHFLEAIALSSGKTTSPATFCRLGDTFVRLSRYEEAEKAYQDILEIDSDHAPAWVGLSKLSLIRGNAEEAVDHATRAVSLIHVYPEAHLRLGEALVAAKREEDAVIALEVCAMLAPGFYECHALLANLKQRLGHSDADFFASRAKAIRVLNRGY
jgi:tetratricopeptide (TPR) repeat protein